MLQTKDLKFAYNDENSFSFPDMNCEKGDIKLMTNLDLNCEKGDIKKMTNLDLN